MEKNINIAIYLPDEEAKKFLLFQQYHDVFLILLQSGVFDIRNGSVALHFDQFGSLNLIQRADTLYNSRISKKVINSDSLHNNSEVL